MAKLKVEFVGESDEDVREEARDIPDGWTVNSIIQRAPFERVEIIIETPDDARKVVVPTPPGWEAGSKVAVTVDGEPW